VRADRVVVEHLLPRGGVHARGVGEDPVEVEEAGACHVGKTEHGAQLTEFAFPAGTALSIKPVSR
jgi:hypothetical protein